MANFEAFCWNFLLSTNPEIGRSDYVHFFSPSSSIKIMKKRRLYLHTKLINGEFFLLFDILNLQSAWGFFGFYIKDVNYV